MFYVGLDSSRSLDIATLRCYTSIFDGFIFLGIGDGSLIYNKGGLNLTLTLSRAWIQSINGQTNFTHAQISARLCPPCVVLPLL